MTTLARVNALIDAANNVRAAFPAVRDRSLRRAIHIPVSETAGYDIAIAAQAGAMKIAILAAICYVDFDPTNLTPNLIDPEATGKAVRGMDNDNAIVVFDILTELIADDQIAAIIGIAHSRGGVVFNSRALAEDAANEAIYRGMM